MERVRAIAARSLVESTSRYELLELIRVSRECTRTYVWTRRTIKLVALMPIVPLSTERPMLGEFSPTILSSLGFLARAADSRNARNRNTLGYRSAVEPIANHYNATWTNFHESTGEKIARRPATTRPDRAPLSFSINLHTNRRLCLSDDIIATNVALTGLRLCKMKNNARCYFLTSCH